MRWYLLVPPFYLLLIAVLVYLQFGGAHTTETQAAGLSILCTRRRPLFGEPVLRALEVRHGPFALRFSRSAPLRIRDGGGFSRRELPTGFQSRDDALVVSFADQLDLLLRRSDTLLDVAALPGSKLPLPADIDLSFTFSGPAAQTVPGLPVVSFTQGECVSYVTAATGAQISSERLQATLRSAGENPVASVQLCSELTDPRWHWFSQGALYADRQQYDALVQEYRDTVYRSCETRVRNEREAALGDEGLLLALLAESLARGTYAQTVGALSAGLSGTPGAATQSRGGGFPAAAFLGSVDRHVLLRSEGAIELVRDAVERAGQGDATVFAVPNLLATLLNHGSRSSAEQLMRLADSLPLDSTAPGTLLQLAGFYLDVQTILEPSEELGARLRTIVTERLIPSVYRAQNGTFFLPARAAGEESRRTFEAGRLLVQIGTLEREGWMEFLGRNCILSGLSLMSAGGSFPLRIGLDGTRVVATGGSLSAEQLYFLVVDDPPAPREVSLRSEAGVLAWLFTAAGVSDLAYTAQALRFRFRFPVGQTHYMALTGIPEVAQVRFHGLEWRLDPEYLSYSEGLFYEQAAQTLYVKCRQREQSEELLMLFR